MAGGFAGDVTFFLIGAVALGAAVEESGLAVRAARFLSRGARGSTTRLYVQLIAGIPALALLVPSAITRNAMLIPAYRDALAAMGVGQATRAGRAVMLALGVLNPLASSALLTGGITSITAATPIGGFSWLGWFALMAVPYYALLCVGALALRLLVGRFECGDDVPPTAAATTPLAPAEKRTLTVLGITSGLWLDAVILYPVQTAANLMAYESGAFDRADVMKMGLAMLALTVLVVQLSLSYWAPLGLPLTAS